MILKQLSIEEVRAELRLAGLSERSVPYRGYATTLHNDGQWRTFIGHSPEGKYLLQKVRNDIPSSGQLL